MGIKRDKRDKVFSKLVRARANWTCERCGAVHARNSQGLHCSHYMGRAHRATRWSGENAAAHCHGCHSALDGDPPGKVAWFTKYLGEGLAEITRQKARGIVKYTQPDLEDIYQHLKREYAELEAQRDAGVVGRIEFEEAQ